jgi:hydroxymethylpyrimidine/phosphomethylpyrimidine kinase
MTSIAVTIAGSDSGGGAGIAGDLKTFSALGVYGACVITALTAQNTNGVSAIHDVPPDFVAAQIDAVFSDLDVGAVKIGMLSQAAVIRTVAAGLDRWRQAQVVLDPVLVASSGHRLIDPAALDILREALIPRALVLTPNLPEAAALLDGTVAENEAAMLAQARALLALGAKTVVLKGGHASGPESIDLIVDRNGTVALPSRRIASRNTHGTGCALSAAIAAGLAKGMGVEAAVLAAKEYVHAAIAAADSLQVGSGCGPIHHFHSIWPKSKVGDQRSEVGDQEGPDVTHPPASDI